jgi:hypothetical protein
MGMHPILLPDRLTREIHDSDPVLQRFFTKKYSVNDDKDDSVLLVEQAFCSHK